MQRLKQGGEKNNNILILLLSSFSKLRAMIVVGSVRESFCLYSAHLFVTSASRPPFIGFRHQ